ncbi:MAG: cobalamin-dependent protein [Patescibacteria group bacterium]
MKRMLLAARYYSIEPLGILYLAGLIRDAGWECKVVLVNEFDFEPLYDEIRRWQPDLVGFQIWTGYHKPAFIACDTVRAMGVPVVIGGPHATYFDQECARHADFVVKGSGFGLLRGILERSLSPEVHFNKEGRADAFPLPDRDLVYDAYPELGRSPIKSIFASVGCPMTCTYCYAPAFNEMHGGFKLTVRPVTEIIAEAVATLKRWPLRMVYFQDDIFGYDKKWLEEFALRWPVEVGVPFHAQIRLELARHDAGSKRLDLFVRAGCSGITLAIESGNEFLRDRVLFRHMPDALIVEGCRKIMDRGMTLRTEQILAVPFSDTATDLATLDLNNRINPTMAWTSILAPYGGTDMGTIAKNFGFYGGNNDDLSETFFDRSVLQHVAGGPRDIESVVNGLGINPKAPPKEQPLVRLHAIRDGSAGIVMNGAERLGTIEYLSLSENERYAADTVRLQRLFNWLARVPRAETLGKRLVSIGDNAWSWEQIGRETDEHLRQFGYAAKLAEWKHSLAREMGVVSPDELPEHVIQNPAYFAFLPEGGVLAAQAAAKGVFDPAHTTQESLDELGTLTRRHLFHYGLYQIEKGRNPVASV